MANYNWILNLKLFWVQVSAAVLFGHVDRVFHCRLLSLMLHGRVSCVTGPLPVLFGHVDLVFHCRLLSVVCNIMCHSASIAEFPMSLLPSP